LNSSEREDIQTMNRQVFGRLFFGVMERKTGLSQWPILSRIVAAQFRRFGLATLSEYPTILQFAGDDQSAR
jgi:hypothetical protein